MLTTFLYIRDENRFPPENDEGFIEYKLRLDRKDEYRLLKMSSQMLYRLSEGYDHYECYKCHYILGVYDNGTIGNLTEEELNLTYIIFNSVVSACDAKITEYIKSNINNKWFICVTVEKDIKEKDDEANADYDEFNLYY
jgi:GTPase